MFVLSASSPSPRMSIGRELDLGVEPGLEEEFGLELARPREANLTPADPGRGGCCAVTTYELPGREKSGRTPRPVPPSNACTFNSSSKDVLARRMTFFAMRSSFNDLSQPAAAKRGHKASEHVA